MATKITSDSWWVWSRVSCGWSVMREGESARASLKASRTFQVLTHRVSVSQSPFPNLPRSESNTMLMCWDAHTGFSISVFPFPKPKIETSSIFGIWEIGKRKNGNGDSVCEHLKPFGAELVWGCCLSWGWGGVSFLEDSAGSEPVIQTFKQDLSA